MDQYIKDTEEAGISDRDEQSVAYRFLAKYYNEKNLLDEAYEFATKCTEFADTREEDKALLKEIASKRGAGMDGGMNASGMEVTGGHSVIASRLRPTAHLLPHSPSVSSASPRRDLEPVNLNFTP